MALERKRDSPRFEKSICATLIWSLITNRRSPLNRCFDAWYINHSFRRRRNEWSNETMRPSRRTYGFVRSFDYLLAWIKWSKTNASFDHSFHRMVERNHSFQSKIETGGGRRSIPFQSQNEWNGQRTSFTSIENWNEQHLSSISKSIENGRRKLFISIANWN